MITNVIRWFLVRYLNFADHHSTIIRKIDKGFERKLDFKDKKIPVKIRDIHKIEKKKCVSLSVFGYENKVIQVSKNAFKSRVDLLLIENRPISLCLYQRF